MEENHGNLLAYWYINSIHGIGVIKMHLSSIVEFK